MKRVYRSQAHSLFLSTHDRKNTEECLGPFAFRNHDSCWIRGPVDLPNEHLFANRELTAPVLVREVVIAIIEVAL